MNLRQLKIFVEVAKQNSITLAAKKLYLAQPSISLAINQIEQEYNILLFKRIKQRIFLTNDGEKLLKYAQSVLNELEKFEEMANNISKNPSLKVACSLSIGEKILPKLLKNYQNITDFDFHLDILNSSKIINMVENGNIDFGIIEMKLCKSNNLIAHHLFTDRLVILKSVDYQTDKIDTLEKLSKYPLLLREKNSGTREVFDTSTNNYNFNIFCESSSNTSLLELCKQKMGIAIIPFSLARSYIDNKILEEIKINNLDLSRPISLIYRKNRTISKNENSFINYFKNYSYN